MHRTDEEIHHRDASLLMSAPPAQTTAPRYSFSLHIREPQIQCGGDDESIDDDTGLPDTFREQYTASGFAVYVGQCSAFTAYLEFGYFNRQRSGRGPSALLPHRTIKARAPSHHKGDF